MQNEKSYTDWILRSEDLSGNLREFQLYLQGAGGAAAAAPSPAKKWASSSQSSQPLAGSGTIPSGKHSGKSFQDVLRSDPGYCSWVVGLDDVKANWMKELREFAIANGVKAAAKRSY
jgi:hypothetical protein